MTTSSTEAQWSAMSKCVQSFIQRSDTEPFRVPVDYESLGLYDYPTIIQHPMDLGTVKKRILDRKYDNIFQAADDVRLVWTNCMTYNADGSDFFVLAETLSKKWEERYAKLLKDLNIEKSQAVSHARMAGGISSSDANNRVTLDEKRAFARSLYKLTKEDLGKLLMEIDQKCPEALTKNSIEDECEFNVDKILPAFFSELQAFVSSCGKNTGSKKKGSSNKRQK